MISGCDRYCQGGQNRYFLGGTRLGLGVAIGVLPLQDTLSARDDHSFAQKKYIIRSCVKKTKYKEKYKDKNALEVKYYSYWLSSKRGNIISAEPNPSCSFGRRIFLASV